MMNRTLYYIIIIVLIFIILFTSKCNKKNEDVIIKMPPKISYIHDTINVKGKTKIKPIAVPYYIHDTLIDTSGNIHVYDVKKYVTYDTFIYKSDSLNITFYTKIYSASPLDSINNDFTSIVRHKVIENTIIKQQIKKHSFFIGTSFVLNNKTLNYISLDGLYERKGRTIYKAGIGLNNLSQPVVKLGIYWKIFK